MFRTKFTVRTMDDFRVVARDKKRRIYLFKIKRTLPEQKIVNITKNRPIVKTINGRRKSKYFNERNTIVLNTYDINIKYLCFDLFYP